MKAYSRNFICPYCGKKTVHFDRVEFNQLGDYLYCPNCNMRIIVEGTTVKEDTPDERYVFSEYHYTPYLILESNFSSETQRCLQFVRKKAYEQGVRAYSTNLNMMNLVEVAYPTQQIISQIRRCWYQYVILTESARDLDIVQELINDNINFFPDGTLYDSVFCRLKVYRNGELS